MITIAGVVFLGFAALQAARMALADGLYQKNTLESVRAAVRLDPANASYHSLLSEHQSSAGLDSLAPLRAAAQLSPHEARYLNLLGFRAEVEQDYPAAERALLRTATMDTGFRPRWALMNFYFRRKNDAQFWLWARRSLARSYGDLTPVFRLCWAQTDSGSTIEYALPDDAGIRLRYLQYLNAEQPPTEADHIAHQVAEEITDRTGLDAVLAYCSRAALHNPPAAVSVWNILCARRLLPHTPLDTKTGPVLNNGTFASELDGKGFNWRLRGFGGVTVNSGPQTGLILRLDGSQPEIFDLLEQPVPLDPGRSYRLTFTYRIAPETVSSGLYWRLDGTDASLIAASGELNGGESREQSLVFASGPHRLGVLRLGFRRKAGTVRWSGTATISQVAIVPLP